MDYQSIILTGVAALACMILAILLKASKQAMLQTITQLIQEAETAIRGSGMGAERKKWVIAQLQAAGVTVTGSLSNCIDDIVALLNEQGAWLGQQAQKGVDGCE